jgi:hypothetical protein
LCPAVADECGSITCTNNAPQLDDAVDMHARLPMTITPVSRLL